MSTRQERRLERREEGGLFDRIGDGLRNVFNRTVATVNDNFVEPARENITFMDFVSRNSCARQRVLQEYSILLKRDANELRRNQIERGNVDNAQNIVDSADFSVNDTIRNQNRTGFIGLAAHWIERRHPNVAAQIMRDCATRPQRTQLPPMIPHVSKSFSAEDIGKTPFDRRLDRLEINVSKVSDDKYAKHSTTIVPMASALAEISTSGYILNEAAVPEHLKKGTGENDIIPRLRRQYEEMLRDEFYKGVPALQNTYALVRLFGANGGKHLMNQKGERRWYEIDVTNDSALNYSSTPTTSTIISWGNADPFGRTPYHFTDFAFCKHWKKIENNRLITLRRYAAPMVDNLNFPGMTKVQADAKPSEANTTIHDVAFPPMASAITYFGEGTGNSLTSLLNFTTGFKWGDAKGEIWNVTAQEVPDSNTGPGGSDGLFPSLSGISKMLGIFTGNFNPLQIMNGGILPPDPYEQGPYENRIRGPVNRIDSVKKREPGLEFTWSGLKLVFEYSARPIGGINTKAALLDILGNFLVIGSASAVFFGGAHRFMSAPGKYPFLGGPAAIENWYRGNPIGWGISLIKNFADGGRGTGVRSVSGGDTTAQRSGNVTGGDIIGGLSDGLSRLFNSVVGLVSGLTSGAGILSNLLTGAAGNYITHEIAKKSTGSIPYLTGLRSVLTGEPVGEWHVTIGNPLNPIAMIGNLVCTNISVEFNEELGPDDFPTEMKVTVTLDHGMARDKDAIQSVFNRGSGRIYTLPDSFIGSADFQTVVDSATVDRVQVGRMPGGAGWGQRFAMPGMDSRTLTDPSGRTNVLHGSASIWNRSYFSLGVSENSAVQFLTNKDDIFKSGYRAVNWIAQRSLQ